MRQHVQRHLGFIKTTVLGGIVFMLPLAVIGWLLAQVAPFGYSAYKTVRGWLSQEENKKAIEDYANLDTGDYVLLLLAVVVFLAGLCFVAGMVARRSLGRWFTDRAERYLLMLFPRYAVFKDQLTGNLGGATLLPVVVKIGPQTRIGMEVERDHAGRVTVYLPGSPDPWSGTVQIVAAENVTPIKGEFIDVMTTFEQLGRGVGRYVPSSIEP